MFSLHLFLHFNTQVVVASCAEGLAACIGQCLLCYPQPCFQKQASKKASFSHQSHFSSADSQGKIVSLATVWGFVVGPIIDSEEKGKKWAICDSLSHHRLRPHTHFLSSYKQAWFFRYRLRTCGSNKFLHDILCRPYMSTTIEL